MNNPVKVIHKYKNSNKRTQYHIYIFVGDLLSNNILKILKKIKLLNLYDTLIELNHNEVKLLTNEYGEKWYEYFFNSKHIEFTVNNIIKNTTKKSSIIQKYGEKWFSNCIIAFKERKHISYSYQSLFKQEREELIKKIKLKKKLEAMDYTTKSKQLSEDNVQTGGEQEEDDNNEDNENNEDNDNNEDVSQLDDYEEIPDEFDMEELENMYKDNDVDPDKNYTETTKLIDKILEDERLSTKREENIVPFDNSDYNNMYDGDLKDIYDKHYIFGQYIFQDDTIKIIKQKISVSIQNNTIFNTSGKIKHTPLIVPSRMYLWSRYDYMDKNGNILDDKIMLGQKWIMRNELLNIDIEPNENIRTYENLKGNLRYLKDVMNRYGTKIDRKDDEYNLLNDYKEFIMQNEIYMLDIYNELGLNYTTVDENLRNLYYIYIRIYFFNINYDSLKNIVDYLNVTNEENEKDRRIEINTMTSIYNTVYNDLLIENEVVKNVEKTRKDPSLYKNIFKENYVTQSVINVQLTQTYSYHGEQKIDLYSIFDNFETNTTYPFIQYQSPNGLPIYKFEEISNPIDKTEKQIIISKWFENTPYGISFKLRVDQKGDIYNKYRSIKLDSNGRVEYKTTWKEEDMATIDDVKKTYENLRELIRKINSENKTLQLSIPTNDQFKFAFISTIQQFELPNNFSINHNDLSDFSRYFYPYVALVIEPRKRQSKIKKGEDKSKFGTYLRYKRISKYENKAKIENRILYFMRNYEYTDKSLSTEISKQFNITEKLATDEIDRVKKRFPVIKKSRKLLKKLENVPKYKPPGISIDIQGKMRTNYKIRLSGVRDKEQLDRITIFLNIFIYLYIDTYLYKNKERIAMKEILKKLTNVAKRRHKVEEFIKEDTDVRSIKQIIKLDKERIGFKPEKGENQWTRSCQNSGNDKRRQPTGYDEKSLEQLLEAGYKFNEKTGMYERIVKMKIGKKEKEITLRATQLQVKGENGGSVFWTCSPENNGKHMYIGFLSRSNNPHGHCMQCCFKKDQFTSKNKSKRDYFLRCLGKSETLHDAPKKIIGDKLYILQDTNKIQEGRFGFLPKYLDIFFNQMNGNIKVIKNHYLMSSKTGYYFRYGIKQDDFSFINSLCACVDLSFDEFMNKLVTTIENDKNDLIFTSLNNGDIRTMFETREKYITYLQTNDYLEYDFIGELIKIPNVITKNGVNMFIFEKRTQIIRESLEKNKVKEDYILLCKNPENNYLFYDESRDTIFIVKEGKNYNVIFYVTKKDDTTKNIINTKTFNYSDTDTNIVKMVLDYYSLNCSQHLLLNKYHNHYNKNAKETYRVLVDKNIDKYLPKSQIIDRRNKTKYIVTKNNTIIPVIPSGSIYNLYILKDIKNVLNSYKELMEKLVDIDKAFDDSLIINLTGIYYHTRHDNLIEVVAVVINERFSIPIIPEKVSEDDIIKYVNSLGIDNFKIQNEPFNDIIDNEIAKGESNIVIDKRLKSVKFHEYRNESYELFRLELSEYLKNNQKIKEKLEKLIEGTKLVKNIKRRKIKLLLFHIISKRLEKLYSDIYSKNNELVGGKQVIEEIKPEEITEQIIKNDEQTLKHFININDKHVNLDNYKISNNRLLCNSTITKDSCNYNPHCKWSGKRCKLTLSEKMTIEFVNKVTEELIINGIKAQEILNSDKHFVSDIVDYDNFTIRKGQKIVKSTHMNIEQILSELFGKDNIPTIGKGKFTKVNRIIEEDINTRIFTANDKYTQLIIDKNNTIFRAYSNCYYWLKNKLYETDFRNIGYYSSLQTDLSNYFKSKVTDWLYDKNNRKYIEENMIEFVVSPIKDGDQIENYIIQLNKIEPTQVNEIPTEYIPELWILSQIYTYPIIVYDNYDHIVFVYENGMKYYYDDEHYNDKEILKKYDDITFKRKCMNIRFNYAGNSVRIGSVEVIYWK
jgi:hypothetical protein